MPKTLDPDGLGCRIADVYGLFSYFKSQFEAVWRRPVAATSQRGEDAASTSQNAPVSPTGIQKAEEGAEQNAEQCTQQNAEQCTQQNAEQCTQQKAEQCAQQKAEQCTQQDAEQCTQQDAEQCTQQNVRIQVVGIDKCDTGK